MRFFKKKPIFINLSKVYKIFLFALTAILLITQLALTTPGARTVLTYIDRFEGVYTNAENYAPSLGELKLVLEGVNPSSEIEVLQNGKAIAFFYDDTINITVSDNSVIEIDGTSVLEPFNVRINKVTENIKIENDPDSVQINSNISLLGRIFIK